MQACRVLHNSAATILTGASTNLARCRAGFPADLDHRRRLANVAGRESQEPREPTRERVSILLQETASLLPRTLSTAGSAVGPDSSLFWSNILERSITQLSSDSDQASSKATIAICGFDKWACSHDLVTALLEDPFTSDATYSDILRSRWKNAPDCVNIKYGKPTAFAGQLSSPSDWLRRFSHAIRLTEYPDLSSLSRIRNETDSILLSSDVLLLLCDPVVTPLADLVMRAKHLLDRPNAVLILTSGTISDAHCQFISRTLSDMGCRPRHVLFVDPRQALDAVSALQASPTLPSTIDRYQRDTLDSRISAIAIAINDVLTPNTPSETSVLHIRQETALSQVHASLSASLWSVETAMKDVDRVAGEIDGLLSQVQRNQENMKLDILGKPGQDNQIETALSLGAKEMKTLLGSLSFWKMIWRVDEIGTLVSGAVQAQWCKGLENQLILQTGCLKFTQRRLSRSAFGLLSVGSLRSPVLENQLQQLIHSPARTLTPNSLTRPIHDRRNQLIQYTTTKLHREAQSAVVGAFGGVLGGAGIGWWLAFGEHILSLGASTEMGTAMGSGALLAMGSIRWAVGRWERAKKRWVEDSERIGGGLARDLQSTVQRTLDDNVTVVASTACKGMQGLVDRRRNEIGQLHEELSNLDTELRACARFAALWTGQSVKKLDSK